MFLDVRKNFYFFIFSAASKSIIIAILGVIGYRIAKKQRDEDMLFLVWSIVMLLAMYGQNRWAYYFAVNAALLVGYAGGAICDSVLKWGGWSWRIDTKNIGISHILSLATVLFVVIFFAYPSAVATAIGDQPISKWGGGEPSDSGFSEWLEILTWMRYNTPDPGIDCLAIYEKPKNSAYSYPDTAYGVMSWWDYGMQNVPSMKYYENIYNVLYGGNIPLENSGLVKVFEFVKGAKITGRAPPDSTVTLTNTIKAN